MKPGDIIKHKTNGRRYMVDVSKPEEDTIIIYPIDSEGEIIPVPFETFYCLVAETFDVDIPAESRDEE